MSLKIPIRHCPQKIITGSTRRQYIALALILLIFHSPPVWIPVSAFCIYTSDRFFFPTLTENLILSSRSLSREVWVKKKKSNESKNRLITRNFECVNVKSDNWWSGIVRSIPFTGAFFISYFRKFACNRRCEICGYRKSEKKLYYCPSCTRRRHSCTYLNGI